MQMLEKHVKPFALKRAFHGYTPVLRNHERGIAGASNRTNNAEASGVEGLNGSNNSVGHL